MTTPAQTTLLHAAELLEADANTLSSLKKDGRIHQNALQNAVEDLLRTALELRLLAKRIIPITAVSPVPNC